MNYKLCNKDLNHYDKHYILILQFVPIAIPGSDNLWPTNNQDKVPVIDMLTDIGKMAYLSSRATMLNKHTI